MAETLISAAAAIIVGLLSFFGALIAGKRSGREMKRRIDVAQAVTDTKLEELTREVRELNASAKNLPVIEERIRSLDRRVREVEKNEGRYITQ